MNRRTFLAGVPLLPSLTRADNAEQSFTALFDGESLRGWVVEEGGRGPDFSAREGALWVQPEACPPTYLRSAKEYENFDYRGEFFIDGWMDSGVYLHAPEHGRPAWAGFEIKIFHRRDENPTSESMGALFPLIPPRKVNVRDGKQWNDFRILMNWPELKVWTNGELVQDLNVESIPELRYRLRRGHLGFAAAATPIAFRNLRIQELPTKEKWETLYETEHDIEKWFVSEGNPNIRADGGTIRGDGMGHLATSAKFKDFELQLYIRGCRAHNGGILFRSAGEGLKNPRHYEIQLHNVEEAHYPTGSLYDHRRAIYPRIEDGKWFLMQLRVENKRCLVRINGDTAVDYDRLENVEEGHIELQAHRPGYWIEYKHIRIRRLS
jgi:hypothetical protein